MPRKLRAECPRYCATRCASRCLHRLGMGLYPIPGFDGPNHFALVDGRAGGGVPAPQEQPHLALQDHPPLAPGVPVLLAIEDGEP
eukprot:6367223-Pyramimonas_sp.AAC.1